ncbi:MAG TPA: tetratricopeptide repeat protein, partial [Spirochaetota bacterium]|nr:tetratricopeptide repeat protein [Spirochaetota bacterium]
KNGATMLFGETLVIFASDSDSLALSSESVARIKDLCSRDPSLQTVFFSEIQPLTHFVKKGFPLIEKDIPVRSSLYYLLNKPVKLKFSSLDMFNDYKTNHLASLDLFAENDPYRANIERELKANEKIFTVLKIAESASNKRDIETETSCLLDLRKMGEYNPSLRQYALSFLSFREKTFFNTALALENDKLWDDAGKIYRSILLINPSSYDANYRMSVISLTQQKINDASSYLQTAMRLQPENPNVMHQMGVILFTIGKYNDALTYLQKAIALKKYDSPTYFYIGLCYEELNRLSEAAEYYNQALLKDPMNQDNISAIERIKSKLEKQNTQWQLPELKNQNEVEHGEDFPLPINKSAIDVRLKDDNPGTDTNQNQTDGKAQ